MQSTYTIAKKSVKFGFQAGKCFINDSSAASAPLRKTCFKNDIFALD